MKKKYFHKTQFATVKSALTVATHKLEGIFKLSSFDWGESRQLTLEHPLKQISQQSIWNYFVSGQGYIFFHCWK
jgi:hypothetical protein